MVKKEFTFYFVIIYLFLTLIKASPHPLLASLCLSTVGTPKHAPPEWNYHGSYRPGPTTVWQLGVLLFEVLRLDRAFETQKFLKKKLETYIKGLSESKKMKTIHLCLNITAQDNLLLFIEILMYCSQDSSHLSSPDCMDFLQRCLAINPKDRSDLGELQLHPLLKV